MIIDLTQIPIGISKTDKELSILKSAKLVSELINLNKGRKYNLNCITIPPSILSILESHQYFYTYNLSNEMESPILIGKIVGYECYIDLCLPPNIIIVNCDGQLIREIKIDSILDKQKEEFEYEIEVIF